MVVKRLSDRAGLSSRKGTIELACQKVVKRLLLGEGGRQGKSMIGL